MADNPSYIEIDKALNAIIHAKVHFKKQRYSEQVT